MRNKQGNYVPFNTARGCSDILFIAPGGRFGACETKFGANALTERQKEFKVKVERGGGLFLCVKGVDELKEKLAACGLIAR